MSNLREGLAAALVASVVALFPAAAYADEPGESDEASVLVLQAIALIVNTPDDTMAIEERIGDALEAPHTEGVDLAHVRHAEAAFEQGDLRRARDYLQSAIGAGPFVSDEPKPIREEYGEPGRPAYAVGAQAGTVVVLDEYRPDRALNGGDLVLLVLSALAVLGGGLLAWRFRPADTVRQLHRAGASKEQ